MLAINRNGFVFPVKLYVNYYFNINKDLAFAGIIRNKITKNQFLICDLVGQISGFSENFF